MYGDGLDDAELAALAVAGTLDGVDSEIAVLRVLIRRCLTLGDVGEARRGIEGLGRLLRIRHELTGPQVGQLESSLNRVLDVLGAELEVAL